MSNPPLTLPDDDIRAIHQLHQQWMALETQGKGLDVLKLCTHDVRWLVPGVEMLIGQEAARDLLNDPGTEISEISTDAVEIIGEGTIAYKTSRYTTRFSLDGGQTTQVASGTHLWILHKQPDGEWRVALVTWQSR